MQNQQAKGRNATTLVPTFLPSIRASGQYASHAVSRSESYKHA